jgi:hypothetical protein
MRLLYALALVAALSTRHSRGACPREGGEREIPTAAILYTLMQAATCPIRGVVAKPRS